MSKSKSIILATMVFVLCVARLATISGGSGADQLMQAEGTLVGQSI